MGDIKKHLGFIPVKAGIIAAIVVNALLIAAQMVYRRQANFLFIAKIVWLIIPLTCWKGNTCPRTTALVLFIISSITLVLSGLAFMIMRFIPTVPLCNENLRESTMNAFRAGFDKDKGEPTYK